MILIFSGFICHFNHVYVILPCNIYFLVNWIRLLERKLREKNKKLTTFAYY